MKLRTKLFITKDIYNLKSTNDIFLGAMKANVEFHMKKCPDYKTILDNLGFDINSLQSIDDLDKIPPLPTSYLKNNSLLSKPFSRLLIKTTSSGTGGKKTLSGFDISSGFCGLFMVRKVFRFHQLISLRRTNYIILGYQPDRSNQTAMAKALKGFTLFAPAKKKEYALVFVDGEYQINKEGLIEAILQYGKQRNPVRIIGFPAYFKMFLDELNDRDIKMKLPQNSKVMVGGGWKALFNEEISKEELFRMANETLGIERQNFKDHFSTAEHPINYVSCINNHFHVPVFSRVIIRDVRTLEPLPQNCAGLLNLVTPLLSSMPYGSIMTDDIAIMKDGSECGCGIRSPYFELIGRVGLTSIKTCTQTASEFLDNTK
ncbi:MAG: acyl-protein synthetase [Lachnospiraceae bacterium]|jgi:phenylacetate-coenzyme A ligase PaaK-like adenylate-forming protein|nr:acyl-protein synthetase [Lachnospiraceae bacterium]